MSKNHLGAVYMIMSVLFFSFMDILIKVTDEYDVGQTMFFRAFFGLIPIYFLIPKEKITDFYKTKNFKLHFYRSFFGAIAMAAIFNGLRNLQLAEVTALAFSAPLWVVIFSMFFLSETIRLKRWIAGIGLGFVGTIIISKPGFDNLNFYYIYPIIFCIGFAGVSIIIRKLTLVGEPVWLIAFYFSLVSGLGGLLTIPLGLWKMPNTYDFILFILIGLLGSVANLLLTQSYKLAEVTLTTPLKYLSLVFAIIFGFYFFKEIPTIYTLSGAGLIVVSSAIIFFRESELKKPITLPRQQ